jgi:hypothetical protein
MKNVLLTFVVFLMGCDGAVNSGNQICNIISKVALDVSPEPRELQVEIKRCNDESHELQISLASKIDGHDWVLVKQDLGNSTAEPTISELDIKLNKTEFREYTLSLPVYVDINKYMNLRTINAKKCLELKDIDLCFGQQS